MIIEERRIGTTNEQNRMHSELKHTFTRKTKIPIIVDVFVRDTSGRQPISRRKRKENGWTNFPILVRSEYPSEFDDDIRTISLRRERVSKIPTPEASNFIGTFHFANWLPCWNSLVSLSLCEREREKKSFHIKKHKLFNSILFCSIGFTVFYIFRSLLIRCN